uniref:Uncharacterized protein n=1 Tax=Arundo donax TaxID=35708 RepID=A0A0A9BPK6_ARUDO
MADDGEPASGQRAPTAVCLLRGPTGGELTEFTRPSHPKSPTPFPSPLQICHRRLSSSLLWCRCSSSRGGWTDLNTRADPVGLRASGWSMVVRSGQIEGGRSRRSKTVSSL